MNKMDEEAKRLVNLEKRLKEARIEDIGLELLGDAIKKCQISPDYRGLCPFHLEKHPSFYLKVRWNKYVCFGCHIGGGPIDLPFALFGIDKAAGLSYLENKFSFSRNNLLEMAVVKTFILQESEKAGGTLFSSFRGMGRDFLEEFEPFYLDGEGDLKLVYKVAMREFDAIDE